MKIIYRIRRGDGKWSRAGWDTVSSKENTRESAWTDKIQRAKVWKRKSDLNCHLTAVKEYCDRYGGVFPSDWAVVVFEVKEVEQRAVPLTKLRFDD